MIDDLDAPNRRTLDERKKALVQLHAMDGPLAPETVHDAFMLCGLAGFGDVRDDPEFLQAISRSAAT